MKTARIIAIANHKGGVGKSTAAAGIAEGLQIKGKRVLIIDLDGQGDITLQYNATPGPRQTAAAVLFDGIPAGNAIIHTPQGDIIAASDALAGADAKIKGRGQILKHALEPLRAMYDFIIIDTPPALGMLTVNALTAADGVIIPIGAETWAIKAINAIHGTIQTIRATGNPALTIDGLLLSRYNPRTVLSRDLYEIIEQAAAALETKVFKAAIHEGIAVKETHALQIGIQAHAPRSRAAQDFMELTDEILQGAKK